MDNVDATGGKLIEWPELENVAMGSEEKIFRSLCMLFGLAEISHTNSLRDEISMLIKLDIVHPKKRFLLEIPKRDIFACKTDFEVFVLVGGMISNALE